MQYLSSGRTQIKEPPTVFGKAMRSLDRETKGSRRQTNRITDLSTEGLRDANASRPVAQDRHAVSGTY